MTCGVCAPEAFRSKGQDNRVFGYVVSSHPLKAALDAQQLYYLGAELVLSDQPQENVRHRPAFIALGKVLRPGDTLLLASLKALGTKRCYQRQNVDLLEAEGVDVAIVNKDNFDAGLVVGITPLG